MSSFSLQTVFIRDNPSVTLQQNKQQVFSRTFFYKEPITIVGHSCLVDSSGNVIVRLLSNIVPETLLNKLEIAASKHRNQLIAAKPENDVRGKHVVIKFGSYVERGGSGKIWTKKTNKKCPGFLEEINEVGQFVNHLFCIVCPEVAYRVAQLPNEIKLWKAISLLFWNATSVSKTHRDVRDWIWSMVLPFGQFSGGEIDLTYLNTTVKAQRGDIYFINSQHAFHNVMKTSCDRQALVFTNHTSVIRRYCKTDSTNFFL